VARRQPQLSGDGIEPDRGQCKADHHRRNGLERWLLAQATKLQKPGNTPRIFPQTNCSAKLATSGATSVIMMTANSAPTNDEVKRRSGLRRPCPAAPSVAVECRGHDQVHRYIEQNRVIAPPNNAPQ